MVWTKQAELGTAGYYAKPEYWVDGYAVGYGGAGPHDSTFTKVAVRDDSWTKVAEI